MESMGTQNNKLNTKEISRFFSKVNKTKKCWEWIGSKDKDGYGTVFLRRKLRRAHRVSYFIHKGSIQKGLVIHHKCNNKSCVNPKHLEQVTALENRRLTMKEVCKNGHKFDRIYSGVRYCSICQAIKTKRLRAKWKLEPQLEEL